MAALSDSTNLSSLELPSKWDIIPIHNSDRATFKACRRKWDWSSPARRNLVPRADVQGIYLPFFMGTGIHYALEHYYNPTLRRDPVEVFKTWWNIQWYGGEITSDWLDKVYDLRPEVVMSPDNVPQLPELFRVRGLLDILPDPDLYDVDELHDIGVAMLDNYKRYAQDNDGFEVLATEHDFSVPIWDYENECILKAVDTREDSPNCGKLLEVHSRGRQDMLYAKPSGKLGIFDHKTADKFDEQLDIKLESDEQVTTYLWAAQVEARYYDLPWKGEPLEELVYQVLRKAAPKPPTIVRGGLFSVDRANESTTWELLSAWMKDANVQYADLDEKHQSYVDWIREVGDEQFIQRKLVRRSQHQLRNAGYRIYLEALDMLAVSDSNSGVRVLTWSGPRIYPNFRRDWSCLNCAFRPPCLAKENGEDVDFLLRESYQSNRDR